MVDRILTLPEGSRLLVLAPMVRGRKGEYRKELKQLQADGFARVRIDGILYELTEAPELDKQKKHTIEVVVDRLIIKTGLATRLAESLETALRLAEGLVQIEGVDTQPAVPRLEPLLFSTRYACVECGVSLPEIAPRTFSFNSPHGACTECTGLGTRLYFDPELVVPDPALSLRRGALAPWSTRTGFTICRSLRRSASTTASISIPPTPSLPLGTGRFCCMVRGVSRFASTTIRAGSASTGHSRG
jgi:excinuclease ABC subunit A